MGVGIAALCWCALASSAASEDREPVKPTLHAEPLGDELGRWHLVESDPVKLILTAPGAARAKVVYRPFEAVGRHVQLIEIESLAEDEIEIQWNTGPDLAGDVWAVVEYPGGAKEKTDVLSLAREASVRENAAQVPLDSVGGSVDSEMSSRSDKLTGGEIEHTDLEPGDPRIWITVDAPAFRLTLWQAGKEVKTYPIGIGRKSFPLPIGPRKATEIVWNPDWIPPDTAWVASVKHVEPGERIPASDRRNPLGKVKIRLGDAVLIHEARKPTDIGALVSHGCVRMLTQDLYDLAEKIVAARSLPVTEEQIAKAKATTARLAVELDPPLWVDIDYDTEVIEGGELHLYPDIYARSRDPLKKLRDELEDSGVAGKTLDERTLRQMKKRVSATEEFVVAIEDLEAGRALTAGQAEPLTHSPVHGSQSELGGRSPPRPG
jgi:lipoprotein-anchoring transpeptidase ErfK/SrfK